MARAKKTNAVEAQTTEVQKIDLPLDGSKGKEFIEQHGGVSKAMRALAAEGHKYGAIAKMLNKRYQHVRNVMITPVGKEK